MFKSRLHLWPGKAAAFTFSWVAGATDVCLNMWFLNLLFVVYILYKEFCGQAMEAHAFNTHTWEVEPGRSL